MHLCVISLKECWQGDDGLWYSSGGFPLQMGAIGSLFDSMTLVVPAVHPKRGAIPLPRGANVVPVFAPRGKDFARKIFLLRHLLQYFIVMTKRIMAADVVHVPLPGDLPLIGLLMALALRKRLIVRYGGSWTANSETTIWNRISRQVMRLFAGSRNVMFVTGAGFVPPARRMHWLFATSISREEVESTTVNLKRPPESPLRLIYAGRLSPEKGLLYLLRALGLLKNDCNIKEQFPSLLIAGDGPQHQELIKAARDEGIVDAIKFAGQLDRPALFQCLVASDLCVIPSLTEGFCKARLDAMVCGVPVLTTETGPARAIVGVDGERGWVCKTGDAAALAERLKQIITNPPDWPSLRWRCRTFAASQTLEAWTEQIGSVCASEWGTGYGNGRLQ